MLLEALALYAGGIACPFYAYKGMNCYKQINAESGISENRCADNSCESLRRRFRTDIIYLVLPFPLDYGYVFARSSKNNLK